jgi:hypothetical protein
MRRTIIVLGVLGLALGACHSSSTGPSDPFLGHWVGTDSNISLDLTITGKASALGGSGTLTGGGGMLTLTVSGTDDGSACTLTLNSTGFQSAAMSGSIGHDTLYTSLNGSGFTNYGIDLFRQP